MAHTKRQPVLLNVNRIPSQPKKRKKVTVVFDEKKRRQFLTGFRKRKTERQKKAREDLEKRLKEERKRIKQETRERYSKLLSGRDIPEIQELLTKHEYETEGHTVSILELNVADLAENNALIGENKAVNETDNEEEEEKESNHGSDNNDEIKGMTLNSSARHSKRVSENTELRNATNLKKAMKKATLQEVKKNKVYKRKERLDNLKNRKKSIFKHKTQKKVEKNQNRKIKKKSKH